MPIFPPNKGFKMPGVGSKNIDSAGNFRDEQHVDKVGYCDATEDSMLPELSSPFKARYTPSGYLKDIDVLTIPIPKSGCPKGYKVVDGKCVKSEVKSKENTPPLNPGATIEIPDVGERGINPTNQDIRVSGTTLGKTTPGSNQGNTGVGYKKSFDALSAKQKKEYGDLKGWTTYVQDYWAKKNAKTTTGGTTSLSSNPK